MATAEEIYTETVRSLPSSERLRLATMILEGLSSSAGMLDYSDAWSENDLADLTRFAQQHAARCHEDDDHC